MSFRRIIKSSDNANIDKIVKKTDKYKQVLESIKSYNLTTNYSFVDKLTLYDQAIESKICLYEPVEYAGWLSTIDYVCDEFIKHINIYVNTKNYGIIEMMKYQTEHKYNFYINSQIGDSMSKEQFEYLFSTLKIKVEKTNTNKYDLLICDITDNLELEILNAKLNIGGQILFFCPMWPNYNLAIQSIKKLVELYAQIELISPTIIDKNGSFLILCSINPTTDKLTNSIEPINIKCNENIGCRLQGVDYRMFLSRHMDKIIRQANKIKYILKISNSELQLKLISVLKFKLQIQLTIYAQKYDIPIKTRIVSYYDKKLISITNKIYSVINFLSYEFITYDDILLEFDYHKPEHIYKNLYQISMNLNKIKRAIDTKYYKKWSYVTNLLDNYNTLGGHLTSTYDILISNQKVSNAFAKMYEMLIYYNFNHVFESVNKSNSTNEFKSFHFCEAPGMFIIAINHFLHTKTKIRNWSWYGNSLSQNASKTALADFHGLIKANENKWLIGPSSSGDIRDINNIKYFKDTLIEVDFITSDCGICVDSSDMNSYEELIAETDFAQFINILNLLKIGGSTIIKTFIPLELASNVCLIYTLTQVFSNVYLSKPITSRPANSEVYIVCIDYKGINKQLLNKLMELLDKDINPVFNPRLKWIKNIPDSFILQLEDYVQEITRQQMSYLLNIFHFVDNSDLIDKLKPLAESNKAHTNAYWCKKFNFESNKYNKII